MTDFVRKRLASFLLGETQITKLAKIAETEKLNKSEIIRQLIDQRWDKGGYDEAEEVG